MKIAHMISLQFTQCQIACSNKIDTSTASTILATESKDCQQIFATKPSDMEPT
jgi:hypothetical protein